MAAMMRDPFGEEFAFGDDEGGFGGDEFYDDDDGFVAGRPPMASSHVSSSSFGGGFGGGGAGRSVSQSSSTVIRNGKAITTKKTVIRHADGRVEEKTEVSESNAAASGGGALGLDDFGAGFSGFDGWLGSGLFGGRDSRRRGDPALGYF
jgi:hypothetical protein